MTTERVKKLLAPLNDESTLGFSTKEHSALVVSHQQLQETLG